MKSLQFRIWRAHETFPSFLFQLKPMRFFYRIFTPLKIQPIKIVNTVLSGGEKQLQIVPASPKCSQPVPPLPPTPASPLQSRREENEEKEHLLANLELQSRAKVQNPQTNNKIVPELKDDRKDLKEIASTKKTSSSPPCVFEYEEPDQGRERFAEIRDREWAMQKKLDETRERDDEYHHHVSKKRKKSKHKTSRKLHAEITNKEEELKLKVKLTSPHNGHKHKHHKSAGEAPSSSKEKLLQMRQVRHKHVTIYESGGQEKTEQEPLSPNKEWTINKVPTVQIERSEQAEQQVKKTVKSYQGPCYKPPPPTPAAAPAPKPQPHLKALKSASIVPPPRTFPPNLEKKIANLQQRCTVEAKPASSSTKPAIVKKYPPLEVTTGTSASPTSGYTVSKVDTNKRKLEGGTNDGPVDKRPSLEITLINPSPSSATAVAANKPMVKRPPPAPIPLDRIKKSYGMFNSKSGISIIAKSTNNNKEKCDNVGALDLSSKAIGPTPSGGVSTPSAATITPKLNGFAKDKMNMSNLQMLSKVATEASLNGGGVKAAAAAPKPRPPMPNLQTLKIPTPPHQKAIPNLDKLPKLTEINKLKPQHFRLLNSTIRNLRPTNQNQNIRNIPNPSLLIRQQNQNRLNSTLNREVVVTAATPTTVSTTRATPPPPTAPSALASPKANTPEVKPTTTELIPV